jgi:hypothetical protein
MKEMPGIAWESLNDWKRELSDETKQQLSANDLLKNSSLYREFQAEREEILKHKWIESEKRGGILALSGR